MPTCTHPVYHFSAGEVPCGRPTIPGSPDCCWKHAPGTAALRSMAATKGARTRRRRRSWWGRALETLAMPGRAIVARLLGKRIAGAEPEKESAVRT